VLKRQIAPGVDAVVFQGPGTQQSPLATTASGLVPCGPDERAHLRDGVLAQSLFTLSVRVEGSIPTAQASVTRR